MELIDKETIRKEIERRMKIYGNPCGAGSLYDIRKKHALAGLLDYLDTLPEQPVLPGIEEEGIPGKDFIPVGWVDACERYGKWKIVRAEQSVTDHHEIEVEFRGEKVTVNREFYRKEDKNYSTNEQDDNVIWAALRAWCEKKGITAFELYPQQPEQPVEYPTSTEMIAEWENNELPMLREKDFRGDAERMAYNAFLDGFAKGLGYRK